MPDQPPLPPAALRALAEAEARRAATPPLALPTELGGRKSLLNPLWYIGALSMGVLAGRLGDKWNLGFLAETERQVEAHLDSHLEQLPEQDRRSREIVDQMRQDEIEHGQSAIDEGAHQLPLPVKLAMTAK